MCLAVPGKVVEWLEREAPFTRATVEFGSVRRDVSMACLPEAELGDYVLVHAGMAISQIDADEAARVFEAIAQLQPDELDELSFGEGEPEEGG